MKRKVYLQSNNFLICLSPVSIRGELEDQLPSHINQNCRLYLLEKIQYICKSCQNYLVILLSCFLDIESIPDQDFYYLIGLVIYQGKKSKKYSFWANDNSEEGRIFKLFLDIINQYPEAPIYHYGNFELRSLKKLAKKYCSDEEVIISRLINISSYIYGKIYFPVYSNKLKELGRYLGAEWTAPNASGLQSLVWRYFLG